MLRSCYFIICFLFKQMPCSYRQYLVPLYCTISSRLVNSLTGDNTKLLHDGIVIITDCITTLSILPLWKGFSDDFLQSTSSCNSC